ncbi:MAG: hypothetical protein IPL62_13680 [Caulobacteraceae bacterium]|nr:hypothetical protein [Caulobacteraceae bacterium]
MSLSGLDGEAVFTGDEIVELRIEARRREPEASIGGHGGDVRDRLARDHDVERRARADREAMRTEEDALDLYEARRAAEGESG